MTITAKAGILIALAATSGFLL
jgi:C1A family cysteine protease